MTHSQQVTYCASTTATDHSALAITLTFGTLRVERMMNIGGGEYVQFVEQQVVFAGHSGMDDA